MQRLLLIGGAVMLAVSAFGGTTADDHGRARVPISAEQPRERLVFVTGSLIPQRVKLQPLATTTVSPVRIIDRQEIDHTGRQTTPGAFVNEPSVRVIGH